ncbi:LEAF RUST 10 DISEASE-RESISTANCE LOCUS RECEPTOR-LIKE PROTEIN KINASE-like 1.4 isoform X2 [Juglans microcarpa x Juglans regia]|uniref:LEAF RUST 10 DISEASE-RESISTANCE LOCUS RECEPTOR-LIKE PROTEIN KINASE-like 1.4 isoform X2 n=1 Tax=Juglans microcarpa x Juglans regia TaxID=2249226 RepID=UPI001B7F6E0C|nr:LEAF RUST 10 DISEASE-RESISTANCE LOCUS RECEPTOR-LIKE PROTEIN KINASE-like 1.4 isoform X2 [Juglans microcarpa x Juglans regia]
MHPITIPPVFLLLFSVFVATSFPSDEATAPYFDCPKTFDCGPFKNLSYPFSNRGECGHSEFRLTCDNEFAGLTVASMSYRVLRLNETAKTMTLVRSDLWNNTCPHNYFNYTLNPAVFPYGTDTEDLTIYYGCSNLSSVTPTNRFHCTINGNSSNDAYFLTGPVPTDPILRIVNCSFGLREKIFKAEAFELTNNRSTLIKVLMAGFSVNYGKCADCLVSGRQCGFDKDSGQPICLCDNHPCPQPPGKKNGVSLGVGIGIGGAGIVGILLGFWMFSIRQRKKKRAEDAKIKELPTTPPSGKGIPDSSTNLSQSTPSYAHSKSDLEKGSTYFGAHIFSYAELEEATNNFDPSRELGDGGFGTVYYGKLHDGRVVAVKRLYENNFKRVEQFMNEVIILTRLRHKNLVTLYGCTSKRSQGLLLVYEYISNGTVADHLNGNKASTGSLTWPIRLSIAIESAEALNFLHQSDVIHRDVKTNNILLDENFCVKVADFGLSRLFPTDVTHVSTAPQGTPGYVDPEYYQCYQLTNKSDVYSFGVVLIELISSLPAVDTNRHRHDINLASMAINKIQNHSLHELVDPSLGFEKDDAVRRMTTSVAGLAFRCLQQERDMRPKMDEVLEVLKRIKNEEMGAEKAEVVDIRVDDVGQLKNIPPPLSPDSVVTGKWVSDSTTPNSF